MKQFAVLLLAIALFSCNKKPDAIEQAAVYSGKGCATPTLRDVIIADPYAPTEQANIGALALRNVDQGDSSFNTITANDNTITITCQATGRGLIIDFSGSTATFTTFP